MWALWFHLEPQGIPVRHGHYRNRVSGTPEATRGMTVDVEDLLNRLEAVTVPIICAVDGNRFGGGLELVLACHAVFATQDFTFALPELKYPDHNPRSGAPSGWPELSGRKRALGVMLWRTPFPPQNALDWGYSAPVAFFLRGEAVATALTFAEGVASPFSAGSVRLRREQLFQHLDGPLREAPQLESACLLPAPQAALRTSRRKSRPFLRSVARRFPPATDPTTGATRP